jgi:hypothetical protein
MTRKLAASPEKQFGVVFLVARSVLGGVIDIEPISE